MIHQATTTLQWAVEWAEWGSKRRCTHRKNDLNGVIFNLERACESESLGFVKQPQSKNLGLRNEAEVFLWTSQQVRGDRLKVSPKKVSPHTRVRPRTKSAALYQMSPRTKGVTPQEVSLRTRVRPHTKVSPNTKVRPRTKCHLVLKVSPRTCCGVHQDYS